MAANLPKYNLHKPKRETKNPGILTIEGNKFYCNKSHPPTEDSQNFNYVCSEKDGGCRATATVTQIKTTESIEEATVLSKWSIEHSHSPDMGAQLLEEMIREMEDIVFSKPTEVLSDAKKVIIAKYESKYAAAQPDLWDDVIAELGSYNPDFIERKLNRVRTKLIGKTPNTREDFDPQPVLDNIDGGEKVLVIDSRDLPATWQEMKKKDLSPKWKTFIEERERELDKEDITNETFKNNKKDKNGELMNVENETESSDNNEKTENKNNNEEEQTKYSSNNEKEKENDNEAEQSKSSVNNEDDDKNNKNLPERILIFTTMFLLSLLGTAKKASVDGTFKSIPLLWGQLFIMMVDFSDESIPVLYGWLPDKRTETYQAFFIMLQLTLEKYGIECAIETIKMDYEVGIHVAASLLKML